MMRSSSFNRAVALAVAGTIAAATPVLAAPTLSGTADIKAAANDTINVRWRGDHHHGWGGHGGWGAGAAVAAGVIGAATAAAVARPYYDPNYDDGYGSTYGYAPTYNSYSPDVTYAPAPVYRTPRGGGCWVSTDSDRGYGYSGPCGR
jgi:hypothetical protein